MTTRTEEYANASHELMRKAEEALAQDDLLQASEKGWGAAAQIVKAVAERKGWPHNGHRLLYQVVNRLSQESADDEIRVLFSVANALHTNFYENWMPKEVVQTDLARVRELVHKLETIT